MPQQASRGNTVQVHYKGTLEDGTIFDSSEGQEPLRFTIGEGAVIPGFEDAVVGMTVGDRKSESIPPARAYGEHRGDLVFKVDRQQLPAGNDVEPGDWLRLGFPDGRSAPVLVAALDDASITVDANHPLAGRTLVFDLHLVTID